MTGCASDDLIIKRVCSRPDVYCEDQAKITNNTVSENLTMVLDQRSTDNQTYYEAIQ